MNHAVGEKTPIPDKLYFKIGEVCKITGVKQHVLRYWESEFRILSPQRANSRQRLYRRGDVENILRIKRLLKEDGFTINGAKKKMIRQPPPTRVGDQQQIGTKRQTEFGRIGGETGRTQDAEDVGDSGTASSALQPLNLTPGAVTGLAGSPSIPNSVHKPDSIAADDTNHAAFSRAIRDQLLALSKILSG